MAEDAHSIFDLVTTDAKFAGYLRSLSHSNIQGAITEAVNALYCISTTTARNAQVMISQLVYVLCYLTSANSFIKTCLSTSLLYLMKYTRVTNL